MEMNHSKGKRDIYALDFRNHADVPRLGPLS